MRCSVAIGNSVGVVSDVLAMATRVAAIFVVELNLEADNYSRGWSFAELPVETKTGAVNV